MLRRLLMFSLLLLTTTAPAKPLDIRCWQLQDYDMEHIKRLIDMAADAKVNRIQLSHDIVMDVEQILEQPQRAADVNTICKWAHEKNIKVDVWTHELNGIPKELMVDDRVDLDNPAVWEFVKTKYDRLYKLCPGIDGLVLTMHETQQSVYSDTKVSSSISPQRRVAKLIDEVGSICAGFGKDLIVRTFAYEPPQLWYIVKGLKLCKADIIVMSKCVPHDWHPFYPFNPALGNVGGKRQIVEFDLGNEYTGLSTIPYIDIDYVKKYLDYAVKQGVAGAVYRVERLAWRAVDTPNQAVIDISTKLLLDPEADHHTLYRQWLAAKYGKPAVEPLFSAFMRTQEIVSKSMYVLGHGSMNHSTLPSFSYLSNPYRRGARGRWDSTFLTIQEELLNPTLATMDKIYAEKDEALRLINASISDIERAKPHLKPADYVKLRDLFEREKAMVLVWKPAMGVIYGVYVYDLDPSDQARAHLLKAADELEKVAKQNERYLIDMASDYKNPANPRNVETAMGLVQLAREKAAQPTR